MSENNTNSGNKSQSRSQPRTSASAVSVSASKSQKRGRGRPATVSDKAFIEVHAKSATLDDIVGAFALLRAMDPKKARLYVSMRAAALRKKGNTLKQFPRGRKAQPKVEVVATPTAPVME